MEPDDVPPRNGTSRRRFLSGVSASLAAVAVGPPLLATSQAIALGGVTKIAPTEAEPGEPFTLIDTAEARLVQGAVALFTPVSGGPTVEVSLRTHQPFKTAQGRLPLSIPGGDYDVFVRRPDGTEFAVGSFHVIGMAPAEPTIVPTAGFSGTAFTITDPLGRIEAGDLALFYPEGTNPALGNPVNNVQVSADHTTLTGFVPLTWAPNTQHFVSVRPTLVSASRFGDLPFFVQLQPGAPFIEPTSGTRGTPFTITDPQGRIQQGDVAVFYLNGSSPELGTLANDVQVSADGTTLTGTVGSLPDTSALHAVAVRPDVDSDSRFGDLLFFVEA